MESKFIYARTKTAFQRELPNIPENLNPIVFIEDSREIWVMGEYFSMGSPGVVVTENNNIITVSIGDKDFKIASSGDSLSVKKGVGNNIIISSTALSSVFTELPLRWDSSTKKLFHEESPVEPTIYGDRSDSVDASLFSVPYFIVDKWGHVIEAGEKSVKIRDYVEQVPVTESTGDHAVLLSGGINASSETGVTKKSTGLVYNPTTKVLTVIGGIHAGPIGVQGDLTVEGGKIIGEFEGDVTGTATPKIHLSDKPEYGGASTKLYGHVMLQDELGVNAPTPSSTNADPTSPNTLRGVAASPLMVWETREELLAGIAAIPTIDSIVVNEDTINADELNGILAIRTIGGIQAGINPDTKEITLKTPIFSGYDKDVEYLEIRNQLEFTKDFQIDGEKLSLRWEKIEE